MIGSIEHAFAVCIHNRSNYLYKDIDKYDNIEIVWMYCSSVIFTKI